MRSFAICLWIEHIKYLDSGGIREQDSLRRNDFRNEYSRPVAVVIESQISRVSFSRLIANIEALREYVILNKAGLFVSSVIDCTTCQVFNTRLALLELLLQSE